MIETPKIHRAYEIFEPIPAGWNVKQYYDSDRNPYQHMTVDDNPPAGTEALLREFAELQELDLKDEATALIARRHCAFFIRIIRFKFNPRTAEDWDNALQELEKTGYVGNEAGNGYAQAYYEYLLAHPELGRWDYLDQYMDRGAQSSFWLLDSTIRIRPHILRVLADASNHDA